MACQQGEGMTPDKTPSLDILVRAYMLKENGGEVRNKEGYLVHRLDKYTSGLMCVAKTKEMA
jgi:23S rRNA-/tRNA-specific pseudouridylate synthase